jgi:hypothetical protein
MSSTLTPDGWGRALVDEVLFRAAEQLSREEPHPDNPSVEVTLTFWVMAEVEREAITLTVSSRTDGEIMTTITRPF